MRHRTAGKITDNLWYLGREESGVYLLEGKDGSIMINGGLAHILPDVLKQMKEFGIDPAKIAKILILHSHFDHIGVIPHFKRNWPAIEVYGSAETWRILQMQKAIDIANQFSKIVADKMGLGAALQGVDFAWRDDITGKTVAEGDRIDLGGTTLNVLYTPGHTNCSITAYEPDRKALFASDGGGIPYRDGSFASANTNFTQYMESLEKMKPLVVDYLCADHYGYVTGEDARGFIDLTLPRREETPRHDGGHPQGEGKRRRGRKGHERPVLPGVPGLLHLGGHPRGGLQADDEVPREEPAVLKRKPGKEEVSLLLPSWMRLHA